MWFAFQPFWPAATVSVESGRAEGLAVADDRPVEFLTDLVTNVPDGTPETEVEAVEAAEKLRAGELAKQGQRAADEAGLQSILASMPLHKMDDRRRDPADAPP